ncbi:MAG: ABC transporter permease [Armatimonadota bacterium]
MNHKARAFVGYALCVGIALLTLFGVVRAAGAAPSAVVAALVRGAFGSTYNTTNTLVQMVPLLLTGLGVLVAFRGRLFNIGAEGQFTVGAIAATAVGTSALPGPLLLPLCLIAGTAAGALWSGIAGGLRHFRGVQEVLSTLLLNFVAAQLLAWMVRGPLQEAAGQFPVSDSVKVPARFTLLLPGTLLHSGLIVALVLLIGVGVHLRYGAGGFALRSVGANAEAARAAGLPVDRIRWATFLLSGGLCGIAGALQICGVTYYLADPYSKGYGYTAIAVALLAGLSPLALLPSALFFGALAASAAEIQTAGVSSVFVQVLQAVVLAALLAIGRVRERAAATAGGRP